MKLLKLKGITGKEFYLNQDVVETFGIDPKTGEVTIYCNSDSESGYRIAGTIDELLEQINRMEAMEAAGATLLERLK